MSRSTPASRDKAIFRDKPGSKVKFVSQDKRASSDKSVPRVKLWKKIRHAGKTAGFTAVEMSLVLFYTSTAKETPTWCKSVIYGALGYFISLIDGIPDLTPILGYTDDVAVMMAAMAAIAQYITPEIRAKSLTKTESILGPKAPKETKRDSKTAPDSEAPLS